MSEVSDQGLAPGHGAAAPAGSSAGVLIRRAREAAGVHIAALAVALKVPVRRLEALEADRYDLLPDAVFARALASSVCRSLKLDPEHVLSLLPRGKMQPLSVEGRINEPFRSSRESSAGRVPHLSRPALIAGAVLVVAALGVYFWPDFASLTGPDTPPAAPVPTQPGLPAANSASPASPGADDAAPGAPASVAPVPALVPGPTPPLFPATR